jgi:hypothetical protein
VGQKVATGLQTRREATSQQATPSRSSSPDGGSALQSRSPEVSPSVLAADFARLAHRIAECVELPAYSDIHYD